MPGSLTELLPRLTRLARGLDGQLGLWEKEPDPALLETALPALRQRVDAVVAHAIAIRASASEFMAEADRPSREAAEQDIRRQLAGLDAGLSAIRGLHAGPSRATMEEGGSG